MKTVIAVAVMSLGLMGCTATRVWVQEGKTHQEFARDNSGCMAMARSGNIAESNGSAGDSFRQMGDLAGQQSVYQECMEGKGWRVEVVEPKKP